MGKPEIWHFATPKPLNRSSPTVAHVITSWIPVHVQNFVTIPRLQEIARQKCLLGFVLSGFFRRPTAEALEPILYAKYVKRRGSAQGCAFSGLEFFTFKPFQWLKWGGQGTQLPAPIWAPCNSMSPPDYLHELCTISILNTIKCYFMPK